MPPPPDDPRPGAPEPAAEEPSPSGGMRRAAGKKSTRISLATVVALLGAFVAVTHLTDWLETQTSKLRHPFVAKITNEVVVVKRNRDDAEKWIQTGMNHRASRASAVRQLEANVANRNTIVTTLAGITTSQDARRVAQELAAVVRKQIDTANAYRDCFASPSFDGTCVAAERPRDEQAEVKRIFVEDFNTFLVKEEKPPLTPADL